MAVRKADVSSQYVEETPEILRRPLILVMWHMSFSHVDGVGVGVEVGDAGVGVGDAGVGVGDAGVGVGDAEVGVGDAEVGVVGGGETTTVICILV